MAVLIATTILLGGAAAVAALLVGGIAHAYDHAWNRPKSADYRMPIRGMRVAYLADPPQPPHGA